MTILSNEARRNVCEMVNRFQEDNLRRLHAFETVLPFEQQNLRGHVKTSREIAGLFAQNMGHIQSAEEANQASLPQVRDMLQTASDIQKKQVDWLNQVNVVLENEGDGLEKAIISCQDDLKHNHLSSLRQERKGEIQRRSALVDEQYRLVESLHSGVLERANQKISQANPQLAYSSRATMPANAYGIRHKQEVERMLRERGVITDSSRPGSPNLFLCHTSQQILSSIKAKKDGSDLELSSEDDPTQTPSSRTNQDVFVSLRNSEGSEASLKGLVSTIGTIDPASAEIIDQMKIQEQEMTQLERRVEQAHLSNQDLRDRNHLLMERKVAVKGREARLKSKIERIKENNAAIKTLNDTLRQEIERKEAEVINNLCQIAEVPTLTGDDL
ncbi:MAG TPA: hypothetical protein VLE96_06490 [Chlamydiales bacterium]|nr:hypothetical protein [Chlamydiales bacterium]